MDTLNFVKSKGLVSLMVAALIISLVGVFNSASAASIEADPKKRADPDLAVAFRVVVLVKKTRQ